jgi:hypothetical protein
MALVFQRNLAIPLWAVAFVAVAVTAPPTATPFIMPPTTVFAILAVGIAAILFLMHGPLPWLRTSRALVRVLPSGDRDQASTAITMAAGTGMRRLDSRIGAPPTTRWICIAWTMTAACRCRDPRPS